MNNLVKRTIEMAVQIQQIPAPTFQERERADFIYAQFQAEGLHDVHIDNLGNVYGCLHGEISSGERFAPLVVSAHTDTVFPVTTDLTSKREDGKIYGPGIGDNCTGVAGLFGLLWGLRKQNPDSSPDSTGLPGDIWLVANVGEEGLGDLNGMRAVVDHFESKNVLPPPRAYIVLEGMALGHVYHRALGVRRFRITANTQGGHSWANFGRPSAIHELAHLVTQITSIQLPEEPKTTYNVGIIQGGTSINTIAQHAEMELDLRSESPAMLSQLIAKVEYLVAQANHPGVIIAAEQIGARPAGEISVSHPLVQLACTVLTELGIQPHLQIGSTDANIPLSKNLPAICIGLTHGGGAHTTEEYIQIDPLELGIRQLIVIVERVFQPIV